MIDPIPSARTNLFGARHPRVGDFIGIAFFISAVWMNKDEEDFRFTIRWLFAGFCPYLVWSGLQAVTFYTGLLNKGNGHTLGSGIFH